VPDFVYNIAKGRVAELYNRVDVNDPAAATFVIIPVDVAAVSDATLKDLDDFAAIITAGVTDRAGTGNWNRKTLTDTELTALTISDANDWVDLDIADQTWTAVTTGAVTDLIICYASIASPTNAQLMPLTQHDFAITPDGSDVTAQIATAGFYRAQ
jgi:hypothetical protein